MSTTTETATTVHGEVEYETVECSSCGNMVKKEDAEPFVMGTTRDVTRWYELGYVEYEFNKDSLKEGWACEICRDDGMISFPIKSLSNRSIVEWTVGILTIGVLLGFILGLAL